MYACDDKSHEVIVRHDFTILGRPVDVREHTQSKEANDSGDLAPQSKDFRGRSRQFHGSCESALLHLDDPVPNVDVALGSLIAGRLNPLVF